MGVGVVVGLRPTDDPHPTSPMSLVLAAASGARGHLWVQPPEGSGWLMTAQTRPNLHRHPEVASESTPRPQSHTTTLTSAWWTVPAVSIRALVSAGIQSCGGLAGQVCLKSISDGSHPVDCRPPGSSVPRILQEGILEWVAMPSSRGSSRFSE